MKNSIQFCLYLLLIIPTSLVAQDPYEQFEKLINPVNGKLNFSESLMSIKSSSGRTHGFPLSYSATVKNNQQASWVGLGWSADFGEITRQLVGFPDERNEFLQVQNKILNNGVLTGERESTYGIGPMEFSEYASSSTTDKAMDVILSGTKSGRQAVVPGFDQFHVSGPGIGGTFQLTSAAAGDPLSSDPNDIPHYFSALLFLKESSMKFNDNDVDYQPAGSSNHSVKDFNQFTFNSDPLRTDYIQYFRSSDIQNASYLSDGFLEYYDGDQSILDRSAMNLSSDDIVAFTVFKANGLKYHYSLPVIQHEERTYMFPLDNNHNINPLSDTVTEYKNIGNYVKAWKLTAITGVDFVDNNSNGIPDNGDSGHWVRFVYSKWHDQHVRTPYAGVKYSSHPKRNSLDMGTYDQTKYEGSVSYNSSSKYYLESIETDLEKIVLYKDFRDDDYGFLDANNSIGLKIPSLRLKKIVKYSKNSLLNLTKNASLTGLNAKFKALNTSGNTYNKNKTFLIDDFNPNIGKIISSRELVYDYHLQEQYDGNIDKYTFDNSLVMEVNESHAILPSLIARQNQNSGGKLTLLELIINGEDDQVIDNFTFQYSQSNPDFNPNNFDQEGYYLDLNNEPTFRNRAIHANATTPIDCWLLKQVTYPSNVRVNFDYEPDRFKYTHSNVSVDNITEFIPIELMSIDNIQNSFSGVINTEHGFSVSFTAKLPNPNLLNMFLSSSLDSRTIVLRGLVAKKYQPPLPSLSEYGRDFYMSFFGSLKDINSNGVGQGNLTLDSYNQTTGEITLTCRSLYGGEQSINLWEQEDYNAASTYSSPRVRYLYLEFRGGHQAEGSSRVKRVTVFPRTGSSESIKYEAKYSTGVKSYSNNHSFARSDSWKKASIFYGNLNTPHNSNKRGIVYKKTTLLKFGMNNEFHSSAVFKHQTQSPLRLRENAKLMTPTETYVPQQYLNMSPRTIWHLIRSKELDVNDLPPAIWAAFQYYVHDILIPANSLISSINDTDAIARHISASPIHSLHGKMHGSGQTLLSRTPSIADGVHEVRAIDYFSTTPPYNISYFKYNPTGRGISHYIGIRDNSAFFGNLLSLETRDKDSNVITRNEYKYDIKATYQTSYFAKLTSYGAHSGPNIIYSTGYLKSFPYVKQLTKYSNGLTTTELITKINPYNGEPSEIVIFTPDENVVKKYEYGYLRDFNFNKFWSKSNRQIWSSERRVVSDITYSQLLHQQQLTPLHFPKLRTRETIERHANTNDYFDELYLQSSLPHNSVPYSTIVNSTHHNLGIKKRELLSGNFSNTSINSYTDMNYPLKVKNIIKSISEYDPQGNPLYHTHSDGRTTLINSKNQVLESLNTRVNRTSSTKFYPTLSRNYCALPNAAYDQFTSSSFEDRYGTSTYCEGEVELAANVVLEDPQNNLEAHTGKKYLSLPSSTDYHQLYRDKEMENFSDGGLYTFQIWIRSNAIQGDPTLWISVKGNIDDGNVYNNHTVNINAYAKYSDNSSTTFGEWTLLTAEIELPQNFYASTYNNGPGGASNPGGLKVSIRNLNGSVHADDFRFFPSAQPTTSKVFDLHTGRLAAVLDENHLSKKYKYDLKGRKEEVIAETLSGFLTQIKTNYND